MGYTVSKPAPSKGDLTPKNRVWDFFGEPTKPRPVNRRQPLQPRRKIRPCAYKTASGIPYWPSRDPIGEYGGLNLYGMVRNRPVSAIDILGLNDSENASCTVLVVLGHGTLGNRPEGNPHDPFDNPVPDTIHDHHDQGGGCGYGGVLYIGCNANDLNDALPPNQQVPSPDLPYDPDHPWGEGAGAWDGGGCQDLLDTLNSKIADAEKEAKSYCDPPECCDEWKVKVKLLPGIVSDPPEGVGENHPAVKACNDLAGMDGKVVKQGECPKKK